MSPFDFLKKRDLKKKIDRLENQEDALRDARVDNRLRLSRTRSRLIDARAAKRKPAPSDVVEYKARKQAERIIEAYKIAQKEGVGVICVDNRMIDVPVVKRSERILKRAEAAKKR